MKPLMTSNIIKRRDGKTVLTITVKDRNKLNKLLKDRYNSEISAVYTLMGDKFYSIEEEYQLLKSKLLQIANKLSCKYKFY